MKLRNLAVLVMIFMVFVEVLDAYPAAAATDSKRISKKNLVKKHHKRIKNTKALKKLEQLMQQQSDVGGVAAERLSLSETTGPGSKIRKPRKRSKKNQKKGSKGPETIRPVRSDGVSNLMGLGVFGDMRKFFDDLRTNIASSEKSGAEDEIPEESLEKLNEQRKSGAVSSFQAFRSNSEGERSRHRSRLRGFVSQVEPLRRSSQYDPALLWTGLGR